MPPPPPPPPPPPSLPKPRAPAPLHVLALFSLLLLALHGCRAPPRHAALVPITHGGVGNQIYFLLEALLLARHARLPLVPPPVPARRLPRAPHHARDHPAALFWHLPRAARFAPLARARARACRRGLTHVFVLRRAAPRAPPSARLNRTACLYAGGRRAAESERQCAARALAAASVHALALRATPAGDARLLRRLRALRRACVAVDGHSFPFSGDAAHEYLHSVLHYVDSAPRVARLARARWRPRMTVLHLRYDEHLCNASRPDVCIRRTLTTANARRTVVYVPPRALADAVLRLMRARNSSHVYVAASPYTPAPIVAALDYALSTHVDVVARVVGADESMENFIERELAVRAHVFVGDFASTWSGTVYYKRRTMGKRSEWSCRLVNECDDMAYYRYNHSLQTPQWFERKHGFYSRW